VIVCASWLANRRLSGEDHGMRWLKLAAVVCVAFSLGCLGRPSGLGTAPGGGVNTASRCRVGATQTSVLITEWSGAEKANLEAMLRGGAVGVEFSGCEMRVIPQCRLPGSYTWHRTTPTTDILEIENEAELYAKLPLGAVSLSGELSRQGKLYVETTVAGQHRLRGASTEYVPNNADCEYATHLVGAVSVGAFVLSSGTKESAGAEVDARVASAGGRLSRSTKVLRYAGEPKTCATGTDAEPAVSCSSPVQVFLEPIPGRAEVEGAPGTVKVDFESSSPSLRWDVYVNDEATCTTPCSTWVDPNQPLVLRTREEAPSKLRIGSLVGHAGPLQVLASPTARGRLATGVTFTALGGMSLITGITLTAVGAATDRSGFTTAGLINLAVGGLVTAGSIWLILTSVPRYEVRPLFGATTMALGPDGLSGSF